jgi:hypothetical protein
MYSKSLAPFTLGLCLLGGVTGAEAATVDLGELNPGDVVISDALTNLGPGPFTDSFDFELGNVTSIAAGGTQIQLDLDTIPIMNGLFTEVRLDSGDGTNYLQISPYSPAFNVPIPALTANQKYTLTVKSLTTAAYPQSAYVVSLAAPVPIPAALPLFGSALAFAAIFSFLRRTPHS